MIFLLPAQIMFSLLTQAHKKLFQISGCVKAVVAHQRGQATRGQAEQSCLLVLQCCQRQGNRLLLLHCTMKATRPLTLTIILGSYLERDFDILSISPRYFFPLISKFFKGRFLKTLPLIFCTLFLIALQSFPHIQQSCPVLRLSCTTPKAVFAYPPSLCLTSAWK